MLDGPDTIAETRCLADVAPEPIKWLWPRRFALGKLNILAGQPGLGKSQITAAMAGIVTRGATWPDGSRSPRGAVLFVCCEDDAADTISPRLEAAGADRRKVHILDWIVDREGARRTFDVGRDAEAVRRECERIGNVVMIVIDPVSAYLGTADSHKTSDVRGALAPLQSVAADIGACILLVSHLNKGGADTAAMSRVTGSGAFVAAARSAWIVGEHPEDDGKRVLVPLKNNIGDDKTGFAYRIEGRTVADHIETSRVVFDAGSLQLSAESVLKGGTGDAGSAPALAEAEAFLRANLSGDVIIEAKEMKQRADAAGIAWRTVERAKSRVGAVTDKQHGTRGAWCWHIPSGEQDRQGCQDHLPPRHGEGGGEVATVDVRHANPSANSGDVGGLGGVP